MALLTLVISSPGSDCIKWERKLKKGGARCKYRPPPKMTHQQDLTKSRSKLEDQIMTKQSYNKEFKEQAVQYYLDNKDHMTMNEISKNLGIGASTLHKWIKLFTET
ncbi:transposase, partial [Limosilactobacillus fermentum]